VKFATQLTYNTVHHTLSMSLYYLGKLLTASETWRVFGDTV